MALDLISQIFQTCETSPNRIAMKSGKNQYTYATLKDTILSVGANLLQNGMKEGDRVLFSVRPNPDGIMLALGIAAVGGVVVFADPGTATELFNSRMKLAAPKYAAAESLLYFASIPLVSKITRKTGLRLPDYSRMNVEHFYSGKKLPGIPQGAKSIDSLKSMYDKVPERGNPDGEAIIVFTSGTTSDPKAVVHSLTSLGSGMGAFIERTGLNPTSHVYTDHFMFGAAALVAGSLWEIPENPPAKNVKKWLDALKERRVSHTFLVPADTTLMLNEIERLNLQGQIQLDMLAMGAAPVLPPLIRRVQSVMPDTKVVSVYGMTEILPIATLDGLDKLEYSSGDIAGIPIDTVNVRIDGADDSGAGEVVVSGAGVMLGYLGKKRNPEHYTGDIGRLDGDGRLVLLGRKKDMLIRSNKNIYPGLYESAINHVTGINNAVIVGVPDAYGEDIVVLALVPLDPMESSITTINRVKNRLHSLMDHDAQPDVIVQLKDIPLNGRSSKPDRIKLRQEMKQHPDVVKILEGHNG